MNAMPCNPVVDWLGPATPADPDWFARLREQARTQLADCEPPTRKDEAWRYTSLVPLLETGFRAAAEPPAAAVIDLNAWSVPELQSIRLVLHDGHLVPELSDLAALPEGVTVRGMRQTLAADPQCMQAHLGCCLGDEPGFFSLLNTAGLADGCFIELAPGVVLDRPIELLQLSGLSGERGLVQPRHLVVLGENARATLIEQHAGPDQVVYFTNTVVEIALAAGARLHHERVQREGADAFHLTTVHLRQGRAARYRGVGVALGGRWARSELLVQFAAEDGECDLAGLYLAGDGQLVDNHIDIAHRHPHCTSRENFRGILQGAGRGVFDGRVVVARGAQRTDAQMSSRTLMLSERAEMDGKPQLEINADDVKCGHGATVGQIDPEMLFYLRSRGIAAPQAKRMLCLGFVEEIVEQLANPALREFVSEQVGRRLEAAALDDQRSTTADAVSGGVR